MGYIHTEVIRYQTNVKTQYFWDTTQVSIAIIPVLYPVQHGLPAIKSASVQVTNVEFGKEINIHLFGNSSLRGFTCQRY